MGNRPASIGHRHRLSATGAGALKKLAILVCALLFAPACRDQEAAQIPFDTGSVQGIARVVIRDDFEKGIATREVFLERDGTFTPISFSDDAPPSWLRSGTEIEVAGAFDGETFRVAPGEGNVRPVEREGIIQSALIHNVTGTHSVLVLPVHFSDSQEPCSQSQLSGMIFGASNTVAALYSEMSSGTFSITGNVAPPVTIQASASAGCDYYAWSTAANAAAQTAGVTVANYNHVVYVLPSSATCIVGLGEVGGSRVWVGGTYCAEHDVYAHELGHNLGMSHASTPTQAYADVSDIMGFGLQTSATHGLRQTNGPHRIELGWLALADTRALTTTTTVRVSMLEGGAGTLRAVTVRKPGTTENYYISFRTLTGYDQNLSWIETYFPQFGASSNRVSIHSWDPNLQVDTMFRGSLTDGQTFSENGISIRQVSHDAASALVEVVIPPDTSSPTVAFRSPTDGATVSGQVTLQADASDDVGVTSVDVTVDGQSLGPRTTAPYTFAWNTALTANGSHALVVTARDAAGNQASATIHATVSNLLPCNQPQLAYSLQNGSIRITWPSVAGRSYQLESTTDLSLGAAGWHTEGAAQTGTGSLLTYTTPTTGSQRFFRVACR